jgi:SecD/SecF fusion protein
MSKSLKNRILTVLGVILVSLWFSFPIQKRINLGLDLKGGMHLVLKVETEKLDENAKRDAVLRAIEILRNRIDNLGVGETLIQRQGETEILVQLPGVTDRETAVAMIGRVAQLEFRLVNDDPSDLKQALEGESVPEGYVLKYNEKEGNEPVLLEDKVALSGETIADARVDFDSTGFNQPYITLKLNAEGTKTFGNITRHNVNRRLAILLDDEVISAPNINEPILGGNAQITGQFTFEEASVLALSLRSGALPAPMRIEEERTVGPLLGKDSIEAGMNATIIGGAMVLAFMVIYYLKAGVISSFALMINLMLIFGSMGFLNAMLPEAKLTLTLPGIAGIILTLGMAVDANILINERIREELKAGRPMQAAINTGYSKALRAIIDSNITTLIAAFMLFQFGSGPIKGFAVTLTLGLAVSLFTAVFVTRTLFQLMLEFKWLNTLRMMEFFANTNINFLSRSYIFFGLSIVVIAVSMGSFFSKGNEAYGIDFAGGQVQEYRFTKPIGSDEIRNALKEINMDDALIQRFEQFPNNVIIRTSSDSYEQIAAKLKEAFADNPFERLRLEKVGPVVGKALRRAAILAMVLALAAILVYFGFRFHHFDFATAAVIALLHDVVIALGLTVMLGRQVDLLVITALLTIAGYSVNDTIVIYDRVRENLAKMSKAKLADVINLSLNQTLSRTFLTTGVTLLVVLALYLRGGEVLNTFALTLLIGFVAGTYSTMFIVSPLVIAWQKKK